MARATSARPVAPSLRVRTLGPLRILRDATPVPSSAWGRLKSRALFAYLVSAHPRGVHRDALIELLWPEAPPSRGAHALQVALSDLRAALARSTGHLRGTRHVQRTGEVYVLDLGPEGWLDVQAFEAEYTAGCHAEAAGHERHARSHFERAHALWQGEFLADEPYVEWAAARRERLREDYVDLLQRLGRHHQACGALDVAARLARRVVEVDPYLEPGYRDLMRLLHTRGDHAGVVRAYVRCQEALREGFDGDVTPRTRALAEELLGPRLDAIVRRHCRAARLRSGAGAEQHG